MGVCVFLCSNGKFTGLVRMRLCAFLIERKGTVLVIPLILTILDCNVFLYMCFCRILFIRTRKCEKVLITFAKKSCFTIKNKYS